MQFSKKDFQEKYNPKKKIHVEKTNTDDIEELYDPNKGEIGGDTVITHNQVGTDTPVIPGDNTTDRKKGMSKTIDKHISQTRNPTATFGRGGEMGTYYGATGNGNGIREDKLKESPKDKMRRMVKELMDARTKENDFIQKNTNQTPSLEQLNDVALEAKVDDLLTTLLDKSPDEVGIVLNYITYNIENKSNNNL